MIPWDELRQEIADQPCPLLFATISGAHLYGFPSPDSDYDLRGVHIMPAEEAVGLWPAHETLERSQVRAGLEMDLVTHDILKFFRLLLKRNGYVLEQLYSPLIVCAMPEHEELKAMARDCVTRHHSHHYLGFAATQWGLFEKEEPPRIKPLLYVYRVLLTGIHLMRSGEVEANLLVLNQDFKLPYIADLVERKVNGTEAGRLSSTEKEFHRGEYLRLVSVLEETAGASTLPETPTAGPALNDLLVRLRLRAA
jgi:predicted nucleotidyltransferase